MNWKTWMLWGVCAIALAAETGAELYQKALVKERGAGNLEEAIQLYQRVAREFPGDRALAAKSLVQAARCYEKLGQDKAVKLYEQVARDFADQRESVATARERLAAMAGGAKPKSGSGMMARQIPVPRVATYAQSDGKHVFYVDYTAGGLMITNMDGAGARVILSTKDTPNGITGVSVSPDGKQVAVSLEMPDRESFCVVGIDGSGFREVYRKPRRGVEPIGGWSPDGSHFLGQILEADESYTLISIGARDGSVRKLKTDRNITTSASVGGGGRFSPDGKYVIFGVLKGAASEQSDIHIRALDGSYEGKLVEHPSANRILGFTPDGTHLLFQSDRSGVPAIYGLAVSDGRPQGQPLMIKQDAGIFAESVSLSKDGTLFYSVGPQAQPQILTVNLNPARGAVTGTPQPVAEHSRLRMRSGAWSSDGRRLAYSSANYPADAGLLTILTLDSGKEASFKTGAGAMGSICWAPDGTVIYGTFSESAPGQESAYGLQSVSTENGAVKRHATFPRGRFIHNLTPTDAGRALLLAFGDRQPLAPRAGVIRYNLATGEQTELISMDSAVQVALSDDGARAAFLGRRVKEVREVGVKPLEGGDWKTIATLEGNGYYLQWMPDGVSLVATKEDNPNSALYRIPAQGGPPEKVGEFPGLQHVHNFRVHPNGRQGLFQTEVTRTELWALENFLPKQLAAH